MVQPDPEQSPSDRTIPAPEGKTPQLAVPGAKTIPGGMTQLVAIGCFAGLIAGGASFLAGEAIMNHYRNDLLPMVKTSPSPEEVRVWKNARLYSAVTTFATMGGFLGLVMGLAGGLARRSASGSAGAGFVGLVAGTVVAASLSRIVVASFYQYHDPVSGDLLFPLLCHGAIWSAMGAISGVAFGLGLGGQGRWKATLVGGLVGAAAATVIYEIAGALIFPINKTDLPLSSSALSRGMAQLLVAILSAAGAVMALRLAKSETSSSAPS